MMVRQHVGKVPRVRTSRLVLGCVAVAAMLSACSSGTGTPVASLSVPATASVAAAGTPVASGSVLPSQSGATADVSAVPDPQASAASSQVAMIDPCATPNTVLSRTQPPGGALLPQDRAVGVGPFAGYWHVHDGYMVLRSDGSGTQTSAAAGPPVEVDTLALTYYRNPDRLLARVTSVAYGSGDSASAVRTPSNACPDAFYVAGDEFVLHFVAPHLLITNIIVSQLPPADMDIGNPYWCQEEMSPQLQDRCGA
jgi:hypothetical protein